MYPSQGNRYTNTGTTNARVSHACGCFHGSPSFKMRVPCQHVVGPNMTGSFYGNRSYYVFGPSKLPFMWHVWPLMSRLTHASTDQSSKLCVYIGAMAQVQAFGAMNIIYYLFASLIAIAISLVPRLPDLFNAREKRGGAWDPMSCDDHTRTINLYCVGTGARTLTTWWCHAVSHPRVHSQIIRVPRSSQENGSLPSWCRLSNNSLKRRTLWRFYMSYMSELKVDKWEESVYATRTGVNWHSSQDDRIPC